ncbi:UNVERIFIED_CONTAM: hypothetical protein FKN15_055137 [Acipenser sinensis]
MENQMCEINRRAKMGWSAFGRLSMVLKGKLPLCLKRKVFYQCVLPLLTYGCETWTLSAKMTPITNDLMEYGKVHAGNNKKRLYSKI